MEGRLSGAVTAWHFVIGWWH